MNFHMHIEKAVPVSTRQQGTQAKHRLPASIAHSCNFRCLRQHLDNSLHCSWSLPIPSAELQFMTNSAAAAMLPGGARPESGNHVSPSTILPAAIMLQHSFQQEQPF